MNTLRKFIVGSFVLTVIISLLLINKYNYSNKTEENNIIQVRNKLSIDQLCSGYSKHPPTETIATTITNNPSKQEQEKKHYQQFLQEQEDKCIFHMQYVKKRSTQKEISNVGVGVMGSIDPYFMDLGLQLLRRGWLRNFTFKKIFVCDKVPTAHELQNTEKYFKIAWRTREFFIEEYAMKESEIDKLEQKNQSGIIYYLDITTIKLVEEFFLNVFENLDLKTISEKVERTSKPLEWRIAQSGFIYGLEYTVKQFKTEWSLLIDTDSYFAANCLEQFMDLGTKWLDHVPIAMGDAIPIFMGGAGLLFNNHVKKVLAENIDICINNTLAGGIWDTGLNSDHRVQRCLEHFNLKIKHTPEFIQDPIVTRAGDVKKIPCIVSLHKIRSVEKQIEYYKEEIKKFCKNRIWKELE